MFDSFDHDEEVITIHDCGALREGFSIAFVGIRDIQRHPIAQSGDAVSVGRRLPRLTLTDETCIGLFGQIVFTHQSHI